MKQITAQQFANMFGMYVAKEAKDGSFFAYELKPVQQAFEDGTYWCMKEDCFSIEITPLISDADSLDWNILIEPQEEHAGLVPFDENYAPEGCKAVKWVRGQNCLPCCLYQDKCERTPVVECLPRNRPDRTDVYFVKKEDAK